MVNLNPLSQNNADILRMLDKADGNKDNKIVLKGLSQENKTSLKSALENILKENETHAVLSPVDKDRVNAALKSLNSKGGTAQGATLLELEDDVKPVAAKNTDTELPVMVRIIPPQKSPEEKRQDDLANRFQHGDIVYSQNFGLIDPAHIPHNALTCIQAYKAAVESVRTGKPQEITIQCGSSFHTQRMTYKIEAKEGDDLLKIARQVAANASYKYEEKSIYLGGIANHIAEVVGMGTSAFSTEDLSSNALGIHAAEVYIRSQVTDPNHPPAEFTAKLAKISAPPEYNQESDKIGSFAKNWAIEHGGTLYSQDESGIKPTLFGNEAGFSPVRSNKSNVKGADPKEAAFYETFEKEKPQSIEKGTGWSYKPSISESVDYDYPMMPM
jgi:hypothetical protein